MPADRAGLKGRQASRAGLRSEAGLSATDVGPCTGGPEKAEVGARVVDGRNFRRHRTEGSPAETPISGRKRE